MTDNTDNGFAVYDARVLIGTLVQRGKSVDAYDASGVFIGTLKSLKLASAAVVPRDIEPSANLPKVSQSNLSGERGGGHG